MKTRHNQSTGATSFALVAIPLVFLLLLLATQSLPRESKHRAVQALFGELFWLNIIYCATASGVFFKRLAKRQLIHATVAASAATLAALALYARHVEPNMLWTREHSIALTQPLEKPIRAALIADAHIGMFHGRERMQRIVDKLNSLDVDVVLVAGDWTYEPAQPLTDLLAPLARLRHRILSVPGNHDEEQPGPPLAAELKLALRNFGVETIENQTAWVNDLQIIGLGDRWAGKDQPVPSYDSTRPAIALAHNPDSIDAIKGTSISWLLAGHTHGGQVNLPILTEIALSTTSESGFKAGPYKRGKQSVFVTSGLGMIGLPLRLFQPPVIDILTIH
jgi:uncharacterized protein